MPSSADWLRSSLLCCRLQSSYAVAPATSPATSTRTRTKGAEPVRQGAVAIPYGRDTILVLVLVLVLPSYFD
eukprot:scaffold66301_cov22-Prasinocladus_malaysianus.AAC.1